jgi:hypothetical protein
MGREFGSQEVMTTTKESSERGSRKVGVFISGKMVVLLEDTSKREK